jgi:tRNA threonylcarbamoyladenosine biosynthesis protein TsaE
MDEKMSMQSTILLADAEAMRRLGKQLGESLTPGTTLLLEGELGSGKTTLVQGIGEGLGIQDRIDSPTFTLVNEYTDGRIPLYHLDLYRLEATEIASLSPDLYWEGQEVPPGITVIEWAQRLPYLPSSYLRIQLQHFPKSARQAIISCFGDISFLLNRTKL